MKKKKAPGEDGIQNEAWIEGIEEMKEQVLECLNKIWNGDRVPEEWKIGRIVPIFKKGDKKKVENYRGITLMDTGYKLYAEILRRKLEEELEEHQVLDRIQMGFRRKKGTAEAIYVLKEVMMKELERKEGK